MRYCQKAALISCPACRDETSIQVVFHVALSQMCHMRLHLVGWLLASVAKLLL